MSISLLQLLFQRAKTYREKKENAFFFMKFLTSVVEIHKCTNVFFSEGIKLSQKLTFPGFSVAVRNRKINELSCLVHM